MNSIKIVTFGLFFYLIFFFLGSPALAKKTVTILYTGCTYGQIYSTPG